jgi:hypothetical protein
LVKQPLGAQYPCRLGDLRRAGADVPREQSREVPRPDTEPFCEGFDPSILVVERGLFGDQAHRPFDRGNVDGFERVQRWRRSFAPLWALLIPRFGLITASVAVGSVMIATLWWIAGRYLRSTPADMGLVPDGDTAATIAPIAAVPGLRKWANAPS